MAIERSNQGLPKLKKEVLPPQKPNNGIGVMLVAATAMFFAVASSAFILRARMAREGCPALNNHSASGSVIIDVVPAREHPLPSVIELAPDYTAPTIRMAPPQTEPTEVDCASAPCDTPHAVIKAPHAAPQETVAPAAAPAPSL